MKNRTQWLLPALLLAVSCTETPSEPNPDNPAFAVVGRPESVHGRIYVDVFDEMDTFTAVRTPTGSVTGQFTVHSPDFGLIQGTVFCFTIDGNRARLAGVITKANDAPFLEGTGAYWTVQDNGEGTTDLNDLSSDINFGSTLADATAHCAAERIPPYDVQEKANIQVNR